MNPRCLVVDDDFSNRLLMQEILKEFGPVHIAVDGQEAVTAVRMAMDAQEPYDLVCLDVLMPKMNGQEALKEIRAMEEKAGIQLGDGVKVIMISMLDDGGTVISAFRDACDAYVVKPVSQEKVIARLRDLKLVL